MNGYVKRMAMSEYKSTELPAAVDEADPHALIQLMLDGALERIVQAQGALEAGRIPQKCELIGKAIGLVEGLRVSLDTEQGGDLASNLSALYEYMARRLVEANLHNDKARLVEVCDLLRQLQTGWREMGMLLTAQSQSQGGVAGL